MTLKSIYRNPGLAEVGRYVVSPDEAEKVVDTVRSKWVYLRNAGYALALCMAPLRPDRDVTGIDVIGARVEAEFALGDAAPAYRVHLERFVEAYRPLRPWFTERDSGKR